MFAKLLDRDYTLYRPTQTEDEYGTPGAAKLVLVAQGRCAVSRKTFNTKQGEPMLEASRGARVYILPGVKTLPGDIMEIEGMGKLRLAQAYTVYGHHTEIDAEWEEDA